MPELPEVESFKRYLDETSLAQRIVGAKVKDEFMLLDTSTQKLELTLRGNTFESSHRHGKYLFIKLKEKGFLMIHFGMTGYFEYYNSQEAADDKWAMKINFVNDHVLLFKDPRKIGKIAILEDVDSFISKKGYGPDALKVSEKEFIQIFRNKKTAVKSALMDQKLIAGVGNEFSDEILYRVKIHPESKTNLLGESLLKEVYRQMVNILKEAVAANADRDKLRHYFFLENRKPGLQCPDCNGKTETKTVGGRSAYFCPSCQKLIGKN